MNPDDLAQLMAMLQQQQQPQFSAGQAQFGPEPFGSQVKDYLAAGSGALGGAGLAAGMGRGIARPLMTGMGGEALKRQAQPMMPDLARLLQMGMRGGARNMNQMPSAQPGYAGLAGGAQIPSQPNQGALVDLIAAIMRQRGQGINFPAQTGGSPMGMQLGVLPPVGTP